jgi:tight adherence protein B
MIPSFVINIVLALLTCAAAVSLWLDSRERRINRQLAIAIPTSDSANLPSIRRLQAGSRGRFLHRLANYNPDIAYAWHPAYVLLAGVIAAATIFYANSLLKFSNVYVSLAAAIVPSWWYEVCLDGSNVASPINFFDNYRTRSSW